MQIYKQDRLKSSRHRAGRAVHFQPQLERSGRIGVGERFSISEETNKRYNYCSFFLICAREGVTVVGLGGRYWSEDSECNLDDTGETG